MTNNTIKELIKKRFTEYLHSKVVLIRAVKSCRDQVINDYLNKILEQEPKWETKWNIVYGILTDTDLPKCKFCKKSLDFTHQLLNNLFCSDKCKKMFEKIELDIKTPPIKPSENLTIIQKILKLFKK